MISMFKNFFSYKANIYKMYVISWLQMALFAIPIVVLYFQQHGLNMNQVMFLQAAFAVTVLALEIPSGYVADVLWRRKSIIIGSIFSFIGTILYIFAGNFRGFVGVEIVRWIGVSFMSWADSALFYDSLLQIGKEDQYKKIQWRTSSIDSFSESIASFVAGFLFVASVKLPFIMQAITFGLAVILSFTLVEPPVHDKLSSKENARKNIIKIVKYSLHDHGEIKWLLLYSGLISTLTLVMVRCIQPFFKEVGVPIALFGVLRSALNFSVAMFYLLAHGYESKLGRKKALISLIVLWVLGYVLLGTFQSLWAIPFMLLFYFVRGINWPVISDYINKIIPSNIRATVLSMRSLVMRMLFAILAPLTGRISDVYSLSTALLFSGIIFWVLGLISLLYLHKNKAL